MNSSTLSLPRAAAKFIKGPEYHITPWGANTLQLSARDGLNKLSQVQITTQKTIKRLNKLHHIHNPYALTTTSKYTQ